MPVLSRRVRFLGSLAALVLSQHWAWNGPSNGRPEVVAQVERPVGESHGASATRQRHFSETPSVTGRVAPFEDQVFRILPGIFEWWWMWSGKRRVNSWGLVTWLA